MNLLSPQAEKCGPCLTPAQIKKSKEQDIKDIKSTINYLAKNHGFDKEVSQIIGALVSRLIHMSGPLK